MANQPHHDDDQAKKPAEAGKTPPPAPDTPPRQVSVPNMSLDEPEELLEVEEVIEENAVPVAEAAPFSDAVLLADDDLTEEVESVPAAPAIKPDSDVVLVEPEEAAPIEAAPASEVVEVEALVEEAEPVEEAEEVLEDEPLLLEAAEATDEAVALPVQTAAPVEAEPDLSALFEESLAAPPVAEIPPAVTGPPAEEPDLSALFAEPAPAEPNAPHADAGAWPGGMALAAELPLDEAVAEEIALAPPAAEPEEFAFVDEIASPEPADHAATAPPADLAAAPASDLFAFAEPIQPMEETPVAPAPAASAPIEAAPVAASPEVVAVDDEPLADFAAVAPEFDVVAAESPAEEFADVIAAEDAVEEPAEISVGSAVVVAEEPAEEIAAAAPGSAVFAVDEAIEEIPEEASIESAEAAPGSAIVVAEEPAEEIAEAAPGSAVFAVDEAIEEIPEEASIESAEAAPGSAVIVAEEPVEEIAAAAPGSAVFAVDEAVEEIPEEASIESAEAAPGSAIVVAEEPAEEIAEAAPGSAVFAVDEAIEEIPEEASIESAEAAPGSAVVVAEEPAEEIAEAAPGSAVIAVDEAVEEIPEEASIESAEAAPGSAVVVAEEPAEEIAEAAPGSAVIAADEAVEEILEEASIESAEAAPGSAVIVAEEIAAAAPGSAVIAADEAVEEIPEEASIESAEAAPGSAVIVAEEPVEEIAEAAPDSAVIAADEAVAEVAEAAPGSAVLFAEDEIEEIVEAAPASEAVAAEEVAEAAPLSDVLALEEAEEAVEAASAVAEENVLAEEEIAEAAPASAAEAFEVAEGVSSATRKAEAVLDDEDVAPATSASGVEEAEALETTSDTVFDDDVAAAAPKAGASKTADFPQTLAFEPPPESALEVADDDLLVTDEEGYGTSEASAVDLGDMPRKGSSAIGIDRVAEALESGTDLAGHAGKATTPSVEFDELLDDLGDSNETEIAAAKGKKAIDEDGSTEMDAAIAEEAFGLAEAPSAAKKQDKKDKKGKKIKPSGKATGDDIDLEALFNAPGSGSDAELAEAAESLSSGDRADAVEAEEAEAVDGEETIAEEAEEAEAVESLDGAEVGEAEEAEEAAEAADAEPADAAVAFDEEMDAADAEEAEATDDDELADFDDDAKPAKAQGKKGKKAHQRDEEEEDEDEEVGIKKKKSKKEKIAPPPPQRGRALPLLGGMFVATLLLAGGVGAAWFFVPEQIADVSEQSPGWTRKKVEPPPPQPNAAEKTRLAKAHEALDQRKYQDVLVELKDAKEPEEFSTRGEAKWLAYFKQQTDKKAPLDKDAAAVKDALDDFAKGKNDLMIAQLNTTLNEKNLSDQVAAATVEKKKLDQQLADTKAEKDKTDKLVDAVGDVLVAGKLIDDKNKIDVATLDKAIKGLNDDKDTLAKVNKLLDDEKFKGKGDVGLAEVLKLKKQADDDYAAVNKALDDAKAKDQGAKGVVEIVNDRKDLMDTVTAAFKEFIDGKIVKEGADPRKQLIEGAKLARQKAESPLSIPLGQLGMSLGGIGSGTSKLVEDAFSTAKTITELKWYETREPFIQQPREKLDTHIKILQDRANNDPKALAAIAREADWVMSPESKADAEVRAKAQYVKGLTFRNQQKFAAAAKTFKETIDTIQPLMKVGPWKSLVADSYRELTDPTFYYLPRMEKFQAEGNLAGALAEANVALKAMPDEGRLFAARGLIRFEMVRGQKAKVPDEAQKEIRADAEAAGKDEKLAAESAYINGLLDEELGKLDVAEKRYRQAIKLQEAGKGPADDAGKYRVALGRLLLRDRDPLAAPAAPPANDEKKKQDDKDARLPDSSPEASAASLWDGPTGTTIVLHPLSLLAASAIVAQPPNEELEDKETLARLKDVMDEAEKLKASKNKKLQGQGYCLMGAALSKLGKRTEGLKEYAKGLELLYPNIETKEINDLIAEHPAFQQPDSSNIPNPVMAERHFGEGMHLYWSNKYADAEAQFRQAVKYYDKDARYQYFLGFALLHQRTKKKRDDAIYHFEEGARLEAKAVLTNPYATREVNQSLERIQGELRQRLNRYRYRPSTEPEAKKEVE